LACDCLWLALAGCRSIDDLQNLWRALSHPLISHFYFVRLAALSNTAILLHCFVVICDTVFHPLSKKFQERTAQSLHYKDSTRYKTNELISY
jgi:hypothetical protein